MNAPNPGGRPSLSPDGRHVALMGGHRCRAATDITLLTLDRDISSRFTSNGTINLDPVWSPDGRQIVFTKANNTGTFDLYSKPTTTDREEELVLATPPGTSASAASDWSRDGKYLLFETTDSKFNFDMWALADDRRPQTLSRRPDDVSRERRAVLTRREVDCVRVERDQPF